MKMDGGVTKMWVVVATFLVVASAPARSQERVARAQEGGEAVAVPTNRPASLSAKITSPMGRTGEPGSVRIVAQIRAIPEAVLALVKFFVDVTLLATVEGGPPFEAE